MSQEIEESRCGEHLLQYLSTEHAYFLNGQQVFGVTTAGKQGYPTSEGIINWEKKHSVRFAADKIIPVAQSKPKKKVSKKFIEEVASEALNAHKTPLGEAADIGTILHDYAYHTESGKHYDMAQWEKHKDLKSIQLAIRGWNKWKAANKDDVLHLETLVGYPPDPFAGRFDRLARRGKLNVLDDYKTSGGFSISQFVQAAGYRVAIKFWLGLDVHLLEIVRCDKRRGIAETRTSQELAHLYKMEHDELLQRLEQQFFRNLHTAQFRRQFEQ